MAANVFANGREISAKKSNNKTIAKMPDVCLSPPSPPAGPIPIPYPNFAKSKDTTGGTKKVLIGGAEVGLKGKSKYKKSVGDKPATRNFGASIVSHGLEGPVHHQAGSFDVKFEGTNVVRFGDLTTGNHSNPGLPPGPDMGGVAPGATEAGCKALHAKNDQERERLSKARRKKGDQRRAHRGVRSAARGNTTISTASWMGPGQILKAASKAVIHKYDSSFSEGHTTKDIKKRTSKDGKKVSSGACGGHKYAKTSMPHTSHTEARIIEEIFKANPKPTGGTLVLAVNWPGGPAKGKRTCDPCTHCQELICAVSKPAPGCLDIVLCSDENKPEKPKC
ncbi:MAG: DUF4150 domain-containing protein [Nitrospira sp.]|nr:DUF4150 domain-containing protein [Nitrospira sp.]